MVIGAILGGLKAVGKFAGKKALSEAEKAVGNTRKAATASRGARARMFAESAAMKAAKNMAGPSVSRAVEEGIKLTKKKKKRKAM